jgi:hypothetical protein
MEDDRKSKQELRGREYVSQEAWSEEPDGSQ